MTHHETLSNHLHSFTVNTGHSPSSWSQPNWPELIRNPQRCLAKLLPSGASPRGARSRAASQPCAERLQRFKKKRWPQVILILSAYQVYIEIVMTSYYVHIMIPMIARSLRNCLRDCLRWIPYYLSAASSSDAFFEDANTCFRMIAPAQSANTT